MRKKNIVRKRVPKRPIYKRVWFWIIVIFIAVPLLIELASKNPIKFFIILILLFVLFVAFAMWLDKRVKVKNSKKYYTDKSAIWLESANECADIINSTVDIGDFFFNYDWLIKQMEQLVEAEKYITFQGKQPSQQLEEILSTKPLAIKDFIDRAKSSIELPGKTTAEIIKEYETMLTMLDIYEDETPDEAKPYVKSFRNDVLLPLKERELLEDSRRQQKELLKRAEVEKRNQIRRQKLHNLSLVTDGYEFEEYIATLLRSNGFVNVETTPKSGDYGIDVLAEKDGIKHAVQCKLYSNPVGPGAIQEASTGKAFYNAHVAIVATNSTFTSSAKEMADKVGVVLWDREKILSMQPELDLSNQGESLEGIEEIINTRIPKMIMFQKLNRFMMNYINKLLSAYWRQDKPQQASFSGG